MQHDSSRRLFSEAQLVIPGRVNSPVRAFRSVGGDPLFYDRAKDSRVWDADGNEYVDFVASWGPMILAGRRMRPVGRDGPDGLCGHRGDHERHLASAEHDGAGVRAALRHRPSTAGVGRSWTGV